MHLAYRLHLGVLLLAAACGDNGTTTSTTASGTETTAAASTTVEPTTSTTVEPTTSTTAADSSGGSSSTGAPMPVCSEQKTEADCINSDCKWTQVVNYTHGTQGCQGNVRDWCIPKNTSGGLTSVWHDNNGDIEVLQFPFDPTDLGPDWQDCTCDGPLACLCTAAPLDCPDRLPEFCGIITNENGCDNALAAGNPACSFFKVYPEGPNDGACAGDPFVAQCMPATNVGANTCTQMPLTPNYPNECGAAQDPIFWRDNNGVIETTKICGPIPTGWTQCTGDDMTQPAECKCACL